MSPSKPDLNLLRALFRAGRHAELEARARAFLAHKPDQGRVWHWLGRACLAQGRLAAAGEALGRASELLADDAQVWSDLALCRHGLGEREQAADCFARSLAIAPDQADVWGSAGRNALELGRHDVAAASCRRAIELEPGLVEAHFNLGRALAALGQRDEAVAAYRGVVELAPDSAAAQNAAAFGLLELGQAKACSAACRRAVVLQPGLVEAWVNLGNAMSHLGRFGEAEAAYRRALQLEPGFADAHSNLGNALWEQGRTEEAVAAYRRAVQLRPDLVEAHVNLGNALSDLDILEEAEAAYRHALDLQPHTTEVRYRLGTVLRRRQRFDDAVALFRDILAGKPTDVRAHHLLALVLQDAGRRGEAISAWKRAIELQPDFQEAHAALGDCLIRMGQADAAVALFRAALQSNPDDAAAQSGLLFTLNYLGTVPPAEMLAEARAWGERLAARARPFAVHANAPEPERRLRIGLVSGDFGEHPVGHFLASVVASLNPEQVELFAYETFKRKGELNAHLRRHIPHWRDAAAARLSDEALADLIRADGIDILADLAGHTAHNRLAVFAWRPAPVQVAWLGYFATTGLAAMDWILADRWVLPPDEEEQFVERPWRLPDSYYCFSPPDAAPEVQVPPSSRRGHFTFGCFNNLAKLNDRVIACWARVLDAVPGSRLLLKSRALGDAAVAAEYRERFTRLGITPERMRFEGASPRLEYLAAYREVDIALDPFPFPGGTTSVEGLWLGVPMLTLRGHRFIAHQGETILQSMGMPEWIAADEDDYVAKAAAFAADPGALVSLRASLRQRLLASPLCDAPRFARNLETALRGMWQAWCSTRT